MRREVIFVFLFVLFSNFVSADFFDWANFSLSPFNASVTIAPANTPPQLGLINPEYFVCEMNTTFHIFNATDVDGDILDFIILGLQTPFFHDESSFSTVILGDGTSYLETLLFSSPAFGKQHIGKYNFTIAVNDGLSAEINYTNFTVIEINNPPILQDVIQQNFSFDGSSVLFYMALNVSDVESGQANSGNFSFNASFTNGPAFFGVNSFGVINFTITSANIGFHNVLACATDRALPQNRIHQNISFCGGLSAVLNKSDCIGFNLSITDNRVVVTPGGSGGGGGGGGGGGASLSCSPKWACISWNECKRSDDALGLGVLSGFEYRNIQDDCALLGIKSEECGFQIRSCQDFGACNLSVIPPLKQSCEYSSTYTCYDGIKNCHDGGCEFLVDCGGGICDQCPTCSDGIQNQGEQGIDCSGPCPRQCSVELPSIGLSIVSIAAITTLIVLVGIVIFRFLKVQKLTQSV